MGCELYFMLSPSAAVSGVKLYFMFSQAGPKRVLIHELSRANTSKLGSKCDIKQLLKKNVASLRIQPQESGRRKRRD